MQSNPLKLRILPLLLLFSSICFAQANYQETPVLGWTQKFFYGTDVCGDQSETMTQLLVKIHNAKFSNNYTKEEESKFTSLLAKHLEKSPVPFTGGCHGGDLVVALNSRKLMGIVKGNKKSVADFRQIVAAVDNAKDVDEGEKVVWRVNLAEAEGFQSDAGKKDLDLAFSKAKELVESSTDYSKTPEFLKVFELKQWKPKELDVVFAIVDVCDRTTEYSKEKGVLNEATVKDIRAFANLLYSCADFPEPEVIGEQYVADKFDNISKLDSKIKTNIAKIKKCAEETKTDEDGIVKPSPSLDQVRPLQKETLQWLIKKYDLKVRRGGGGNC